MKRLIKLCAWLIIIPVIALLLKLLVNKDPGYVLIALNTDFTGSDRPFSFETTLIGLIASSSLLFLATYILIRILSHIRAIPRAIMNISLKRKQAVSTRQFANAHLALLENKPKLAEDLFISASKSSTSQSLCYIGAARAAQLQGSKNTRDEYLAKIDHANDPQNRLLSHIYRAEILCEVKDFEKALKVVDSLRIDTPNHPKVLELAALIYHAQSNFDLLYQIMPILHRTIAKHSIDAIQSIETRYWSALLNNAVHLKDIKLVKDTWNNIDKKAKNITLIICYSSALISLDQADDAEKVLHQALKKTWDAHLITAYSYLYKGNFKHILKTVQHFAELHPECHYAQLAVARVLLRTEYYSEALIYVSKAMHIQTTPDATALLAELQMIMGDHQAALVNYKEATRLLNMSIAPNQMRADHVIIPKQSIEVLQSPLAEKLS